MKKFIAILSLCTFLAPILSMDRPPRQVPSIAAEQKDRLKKDWREKCGDCCEECGKFCCDDFRSSGMCDLCPAGCALGAACSIICNCFVCAMTNNYFTCSGLPRTTFQACIENPGVPIISYALSVVTSTVFAISAGGFAGWRKEQRRLAKAARE